MADQDNKNSDWFAANGKPVAKMVPPEQASDSTVMAFWDNQIADPRIARSNYEYTYWHSPEGMRRAEVIRQLENPPPSPKKLATDFMVPLAAMGAAALVPEAAPLAWGLRMLASGVAGAGGEAAREKLMDEPINPKKIALVGGTSMASQGLGEAGAAATPLVAKKFMTVGLPRTQALAREEVDRLARQGIYVSPDEIDFPQQFLDKGYTVGRIGSRMEPGSRAIQNDMGALMQDRGAILNNATVAGVTYNASEFMKYVPQLRAQAQKQGQRAVAALDAAIADFEATWKLPTGQWKKLTPLEVEEQKELWAKMGQNARKAKDRDDIANMTSDFWGKAGQAARERLETLSTGPTGVTTFPSGPSQFAPLPMPGITQPPVIPPPPPGPSIQQLLSNRMAQNLYAQNLAIIAEKHGMPIDDLAALVNGETVDMGAIARAFNSYGLKYDDVRFLQGLRPAPLPATATPVPQPVIHPSQIQPATQAVMPAMATTTQVGPFVNAAGQGVGDLNSAYQRLLPLEQAALGAELPRASSGVIDRATDLLIRPSVMTRLAKTLYNPGTRQVVRYTPQVLNGVAQSMGLYDIVSDPYGVNNNPTDPLRLPR